MPDIIIVAGPNGAGKTSFANEFLAHQKARFTYANADEIERVLIQDGGSREHSDLRAGRVMLQQIDTAVAEFENILIETTLANRSYSRKISEWRRHGYSIGLVYLRLPTEEHAIARVRRRVAAGGHNIPEAVIRRRYHKSLEYLEAVYKPIVDEWYVWDSIEGNFVPVEAWKAP
jgi:predicted ABC-type ATPase